MNKAIFLSLFLALSARAEVIRQETSNVMEASCTGFMLCKGKSQIITSINSRGWRMTIVLSGLKCDQDYIAVAMGRYSGSWSGSYSANVNVKLLGKGSFGDYFYSAVVRVDEFGEVKVENVRLECKE